MPGLSVLTLACCTLMAVSGGAAEAGVDHLDGLTPAGRDEYQQSSRPVQAEKGDAQVVIVGTLHGGHDIAKQFSRETLRQLIVAVKPAAILMELPSAINGRPTIVNGRVDERWESPELEVANLAADALDVDVIPFDREGRNELYKNTNYFARSQDANRRVNEWLGTQARKDKHSIAARTWNLLRDAANAQREFDKNRGPEAINSTEYDMIIATKHGLAYGIYPSLLRAAGEMELADEFSFIGDEWEERNRIMASNIVRIAESFPGRRLVVITGSEHRYKLRLLLAQAPGLKIEEFYNLPEWTAGK